LGGINLPSFFIAKDPTPMEDLEQEIKLLKERVDSLEQFIERRPSVGRLQGFLNSLENGRQWIGYGLAGIGIVLMLGTISQASRDKIGEKLLAPENMATAFSVLLGVGLGVSTKTGK
jgi:hypothetical protein